MRSILFLALAVVLVTAVALGQDTGPGHAGDATRLTQYDVKLTEFRTTVAEDPVASADDLVAQFADARDDGSIELLQTVRVTALANHEVMAQFGATSAVATSTSTSRQGSTVKSFAMQDHGTVVHLSATPHGAKILLELDYKTSRLVETDDETTAGNTTFTCVTALLVERGTPLLVGGSSADPGTHLLVIIE